MRTQSIDPNEIIKAILIASITALLTMGGSYLILVKVLEERSIATRNSIDNLVVRMDKFEDRIDKSLTKIIDDLYSPKFSQSSTIELADLTSQTNDGCQEIKSGKIYISN